MLVVCLLDLVNSLSETIHSGTIIGQIHLLYFLNVMIAFGSIHAFVTVKVCVSLSSALPDTVHNLLFP